MDSRDSLFALEGHLWNDLRHFSRKVAPYVYDQWAIQWMLGVAGACAARTITREAFLSLCRQGYEGSLQHSCRQQDVDGWPAREGQQG